MERDEGPRRAALRARAEEAMAVAVAAANARAPISGVVIESAMTAVNLACCDVGLEPRERLLLIDEALRLLSTLKELPRAPEGARPGLVVALLRGTNELLRRYADFVRILK